MTDIVLVQNDVVLIEDGDNVTLEVSSQGIQGATGRSVVSITRTAGTGAAGTTDTYSVTYSDATTSTFNVVNGANGTDGRGIASIVRTSGTGAAGTTDTYTVTYTDATTTTFTVVNGANGRGITSIARTSGTGAAGSTDTYTITYSDATTSTFTVVNGANGAQGPSGTVAAQAPIVNQGSSTNAVLTLNKLTSSDLSASANIAQSQIAHSAITAWSNSTAYQAGALVEYQGIAYRRSSAGGPELTFNSLLWTQVSPTATTTGAANALVETTSTGGIAASGSISSGTASSAGSLLLRAANGDTVTLVNQVGGTGTVVLPAGSGNSTLATTAFASDAGNISAGILPIARGGTGTNTTTGTGTPVFDSNPTIDRLNVSNQLYRQVAAAPAAVTTSISASNILSGWVTSAPSTAQNSTLPTLSSMLSVWLGGDTAYVEWSYINTGTAAVTLVNGAGNTIATGNNAVIAAGTSARFATRRSSGGIAFITYRLA